jgi:hypothetical protein
LIVVADSGQEAVALNGGRDGRRYEQLEEALTTAETRFPALQVIPSG